LDNLLRLLELANLTSQHTTQEDQHLQPKIVDINQAIELPASQMDKRQNKNDFYRFLLMQNASNETRVNNDILIPRSILKRCDKKQRDTKGQGTISENEEEDEAQLHGVRLKRTNPLLSPKFNQVLQERQKEERETAENQMLLQQHMRQMRNYSREDEGVEHNKRKSLPKPLEIP